MIAARAPKVCPQSCKQWRYQLPSNIYPSKARPGYVSLKHCTTRLAMTRRIFAVCLFLVLPYMINGGRSNRVDYSTDRNRRGILFVFWAIRHIYRSSRCVVTCLYDFLRSEQTTHVTCEPMSGALVQRPGHMTKQHIRDDVVLQLQQFMHWHNCPPVEAHH